MFGGEGSEIVEDPTERMLRINRQNIQMVEKPVLATVLQTLPELPVGWDDPRSPKVDTVVSKQWQDHVIEPMPPMLQYMAGQEWFVRLKDAIALQRVTVIDVTLKTVEVRGVASYRQPVRYAKSDIEFIEQIA